MKSVRLAALLSLAASAPLLAHPGHDHGQMDTFEFAWHHWLTGGFLAVSVVAVGYFVRQAKAKRDQEADR